ncbi:MAG: hypothetical protein REI94_09020 [Moraxellaceae bacterium]|nr:hypothetical protein [Moraxellaceae bacterium]
MQQVRLWAGHLLACLVLLLPVAPAAHAAAVYQYTFTSGALTDPEWTWEFLGERFSIGFSLPTPLRTGDLDVTGVQAWGQIGANRLSFPHPPPATEWVPNPYEPGGEWEQPVYPYLTSGFSLFVGTWGRTACPPPGRSASARSST